MSLNFRKHLSALALVLMLGAQLMLAQHYAVHFSESARHEKHEKADAGKLCAACVLSQSFAHALDAEGAVIPAVTLAAYVYFPAPVAAPVSAIPHAYEARGPPAFLS